MPLSLIALAPVQGPSFDVTNGLFLDSCPCFSHTGNYLYFLSCRDFEPVRDTVQVGSSTMRAHEQHGASRG